MLFEINLIKFLLQHKLYFLMVITLKKNWQNIFPSFRKIGIRDSDDEEIRLRKSIFTIQPPGSGSGLGLNISHNIIVQKHKGTIIVKSEP